MKVFQAMHAVASDLAKTGIEKTGFNQQQKYKFRGIDAFLDALSPVLAKHGLLVAPKYHAPTFSQVGETSSGSPIIEALLIGDFHFIAAEDGTQFVVSVPGQGRDSGDKAINKAMSAAYKYAMVQSFCIPFQGMADSEDEPPARRMPESEIADWSAAIETCATIDDLRAKYQEATEAAQSYSDSNAAHYFKRATNARKKALA